MSEEVGVEGEEGVQLIGIAERRFAGEDDSLVSFQYFSARWQQAAHVGCDLDELGHHRGSAHLSPQQTNVGEICLTWLCLQCEKKGVYLERIESVLDDLVDAQLCKELAALLFGKGRE